MTVSWMPSVLIIAVSNTPPAERFRIFSPPVRRKESESSQGISWRRSCENWTRPREAGCAPFQDVSGKTSVHGPRRKVSPGSSLYIYQRLVRAFRCMCVLGMRLSTPDSLRLSHSTCLASIDRSRYSLCFRLSRSGRQDLQHLSVDEAVAGQDAVVVRQVGGAFVVGHDSSGFQH